jgi:hypothetical protein
MIHFLPFRTTVSVLFLMRGHWLPRGGKRVREKSLQGRGKGERRKGE